MLWSYWKAILNQKWTPCFRQMDPEQPSHEKVEQFVCRLRQKAITCEFANVDGTIRAQLIEKCRDGRFRRKFLWKINATYKFALCVHLVIW